MVGRGVVRSFYRCAIVLLLVAALGVQPAPFAQAQQPQGTLEVEGTESARSTSYLEVWVDSSDASHFAAVVARVVAIQERGQIPVTVVYHVGSYKIASMELHARLTRAKVRLIAQSGVPSDLPVVNSPAWVFVTPQGRHIVEGTLGVEPFIGPNGDFVDGSKVAASSAASAPRETVKMEGF